MPLTSARDRRGKQALLSRPAKEGTPAKLAREQLPPPKPVRPGLSGGYKYYSYADGRYCNFI